MTTIQHSVQSSVDKEEVATGRAFSITLLLALLYWVSMLDRFILSLLVDPIKADLGITDIQLGVLHGLAYVASFTVFGFIFGALADRRDRRRLIFVGVLVWSIAAAASGLAQNFWHLLLARVGLGAGEASLNPCATSIISDIFPKQKLTLGMAVYSLGATIGNGTALMVGGLLIHFLSGLGDISLPLLGPVALWQMVFLSLGIPGVLLAFVVFTFSEPKRKNVQSTVFAEQSLLQSYINLFEFMGKNKRFFFCHYTGFTLSVMVVSGCLAWYPVHMLRSFQWNEGEVGVMLGAVLMGAGIIGKLVTGFSVDKLYARGYRDAQLRWYSSCLILSAPIGLFAVTSNNPWAFLLAIGFFVAIITPLTACAMSALNLVTPNENRGTGIAIFSAVSGLIGSAGGSLLVPLSSYYLFGEESAIGYGLAFVIAVMCPLAAGFLWYGLSAMRSIDV